MASFLETKSLYKCDVIDTREFLETGYIQVRVHGLDPEGVFEDAEIMTPFGGLEGMGMQALPPIGSVGYVLYELGNPEKPVFIGSKLVGGTPNEENRAPEGTLLNRAESEDPSDLILKTQYTLFDERDLTGTENKSENILKMTEKEFTLAKIRQDESVYEYKEEPYDIKEAAYNIVKITDDEIVLRFKFEDNSTANEIKVNEDTVSMDFDTEAGDMSVQVEDDKILLKASGSTVTIEKDGKVIVEAERIDLGGNSNTGVLYEPLRDFVNQVFNAHTHGTPVGPTSPPLTPAQAMFKSRKVKLS